MRTERVEAKAAKSQETMLPWSPNEINRNRDAYKAIVFDRDASFLTDAVLADSPKPRIYPTRHVDCCSCDKIVPVSASDKSIHQCLLQGIYHEVSVPPQCQKKTTTKTIADRKCIALKNS